MKIYLSSSKIIFAQEYNPHKPKTQHKFGFDLEKEKINTYSMRDRQKEILKAIITEFIQTAQPVGSKTIMIGYNFNISSATIRSDMAHLEEEGLLIQPHTSAGRIPTDLGYRTFVNELIDLERAKQQVKPTLEKLKSEFQKNKFKRQVQDAVHMLSHATTNVSFATLPDSRTFFLGLANVLKKPEFIDNPIQASQVVEVLEDNDNFIKTLSQLDINEKTEIFIGQENLIEQIQSCSMIVAKYRIEDYEGYIGLLGPTRMNYAYNSVILDEVIKLLQEND